MYGVIHETQEMRWSVGRSRKNRKKTVIIQEWMKNYYSRGRGVGARVERTPQNTVELYEKRRECPRVVYEVARKLFYKELRKA